MIDEYEGDKEEDELEDESIKETNENFYGVSLEQEPIEDLIEIDPETTIEFEKEVTELGSKIIDEIEVSQVLDIK